MPQSAALFQVGHASVDITPPVGAWLDGYAARVKPSDGIYHPLTAVVTAITQGRVTTLLVAAEWLGFYHWAGEVRARLAKRTRLPANRIVLTTTHTHCGPVLRTWDVDGLRIGEPDYEYIERAITAMVEAGAQALAARAPARLRVGRGWCGLAASRRKPDHQGGILWEPTHDAPHDHEVAVLAVESPQGELRQVLFSYACHPTGGGPLLQIGGDYVGFALDAVAAGLPGVTPAFLQGCGGDQKPFALDAKTGGFRQLTVPELKTYGDRLGREVLRVLKEGNLAPVTGPLSVGQAKTVLHTVPATAEGIAAARASNENYRQKWAEFMDKRAAARQPQPTRHPFEAQTIRFGRALVMVTLSGEICVEYALRLKRELGARYGYVLPVGYANEIVGYIPTRRMIPEGGYEVVVSNTYLLKSGPFVATTEETVIRAARRSAGLRG